MTFTCVGNQFYNMASLLPLAALFHVFLQIISAFPTEKNDNVEVAPPQVQPLPAKITPPQLGSQSKPENDETNEGSGNDEKPKEGEEEEEDEREDEEEVGSNEKDDKIGEEIKENG